MKLRDLVSWVDIDPRKLINFALDPENPVGAHKALIFQQQLGYTQDNYALLLQQIMDKALEAMVLPTQRDEHGQRYQLDLEVRGVDGQSAMVRTGWIVAPGSDLARLVTLYVRK